MDLAYYPGCSLTQSAKCYNHQTRLVFEKLDLHLKEIEDWSCCGANSAGKIDDFMAVALPARNIGIAEDSGYTEMLIPCSACYSRTLVVQKQLADDPQLRQEINSEFAGKIRGGITVSSILDVLVREAGEKSFDPFISENLNGFKPACYYGCMQTRFPYDVFVADNVENPQGMETVLDAIGVKAVDWNYKTLCCGASSVIYNTESALGLMAKIMEDAVARGANCLVATCPMCQMNMESQQEKYCKRFDIKERLPVYFLTELLGMAFGYSKKELQLDQKLFLDGMGSTTICGDSV